LKKIILIGSMFILPATGFTQVHDNIITIESLRHSVSALSHDSMQGRGNGAPGIEKAATFIAARFREAGLQPLAGFEGYFSTYIAHPHIGSPMASKNVIGALKGKISPDTIVIFSAHYDHMGIVYFNTKKSDRIFNGANDNATGVATLIELAKFYTQAADNRFTLVFVAFSAEELGLLGSADLANQLDKNKVHAVINFDMLGRPVSKKKKNAMVIGNNMFSIVNKLNRHNPIEKFFIPDRYPKEQLLIRSDHYSFQDYKTSFSIMCTSPDDKYYHSEKDEIQTIDFEFLLYTTLRIADACKIYTR